MSCWLGFGVSGKRGLRSVLWAFGCLQVVAVPVILLIFALLPDEGDSRFLVFYPQNWTDTEQMAAVIAANAQPLSVEWHGGWVIESSDANSIMQLEATGALLILNGENLGICGAV